MIAHIIRTNLNDHPALKIRYPDATHHIVPGTFIKTEPLTSNLIPLDIPKANLYNQYYTYATEPTDSLTTDTPPSDILFFLETDSAEDILSLVHYQSVRFPDRSMDEFQILLYKDTAKPLYRYEIKNLEVVYNTYVETIRNNRFQPKQAEPMRYDAVLIVKDNETYARLTEQERNFLREKGYKMCDMPMTVETKTDFAAGYYNFHRDETELAREIQKLLTNGKEHYQKACYYYHSGKDLDIYLYDIRTEDQFQPTKDASGIRPDIALFIQNHDGIAGLMQTQWNMLCNMLPNGKTRIIQITTNGILLSGFTTCFHTQAEIETEIKKLLTNRNNYDKDTHYYYHPKKNITLYLYDIRPQL